MRVKGRLTDKQLEFLDSRIQPSGRRIQDADNRKVLDEVFDQFTLLLLYKLISNGWIESLEYPISTGKEANIFLAHTVDPEVLEMTGQEDVDVEDDEVGFLAVKIYRTTNAEFRNVARYINGDPRFSQVKKGREMIFQWARKEYRNLEIMTRLDIPVPVPVHCVKNILLMELIMDGDHPAPKLKQCALEDPEATMDAVLAHMRKMLTEAKLVHSDLSEYNMLIRDGEPVIIDAAQGVLTAHPEAGEFLRRDVANVVRFFKSKGVKRDLEETVRYVAGGDKK